MSEPAYSYVGTIFLVIVMMGLWIFMLIPLVNIFVFFVEVVLFIYLVKRIWKGHAGLFG